MNEEEVKFVVALIDFLYDAGFLSKREQQYLKREIDIDGLTVPFWGCVDTIEENEVLLSPQLQADMDRFGSIIDEDDYQRVMQVKQAALEKERKRREEVAASIVFE